MLYPLLLSLAVVQGEQLMAVVEVLAVFYSSRYLMFLQTLHTQLQSVLVVQPV
jgi:hypothetical protein